MTYILPSFKGIWSEAQTKPMNLARFYVARGTASRPNLGIWILFGYNFNFTANFNITAKLKLYPNKIHILKLGPLAV